MIKDDKPWMTSASPAASRRFRGAVAAGGADIVPKMHSTLVRTIAPLAGFVPVILSAALVMSLAGGLAACTTPGTAGPGADASLPTDPNALVLGAEVALQRNKYLEAS